MNLYNENNDEFESSNKKNRKRVLTSIIICTGLVVFLIVLMVLLAFMDSSKLKLYIDGKNYAISSTIFQYDDEGNVTAVAIKDLSELLGFEFLNGNYGEYTEDKDSCYILNKYEAVSFDTKSNYLRKYLFDEAYIETVYDKEKKNSNSNNSNKEQTSGYKSLEMYNLGNIVRSINGILYVPIESVEICFDIMMSYKDKRINIYTLDNLESYYNKQVQKNGYEGVSTRFINKRAMVEGKIVAYGANQYAVLNANTASMDEIIGRKYVDMQYIQSTKEYIVKVNDNMGLVSAEGETRIAPTEKYTSLEIYDNLNQLYIVCQDEKYGIIKGTGQTIVPVEFDKIGLDDFKDEENVRVLYGTLIPVAKNVNVSSQNANGSTTSSNTNNSNNNNNAPTYKWGFYNINGDKSRDLIFDQIGYKKQNTDSDEIKNTIIIPIDYLGYDGIIIYQEGRGYGIIDKYGNDKVATVLAKIYKQKSSGEINYYAVFDGKVRVLRELLTEHNM